MDCVREICVVSIFCGAVLSLCPEGGAKRILQILQPIVLLAVILNNIGKLDLSPYALYSASFHEREISLLQDSEAIKNRLDRLVIEAEYASYIERRAEAAGIPATEIQIRARWSKEGFWMPDSSRIRLPTESGRDELSRCLLGELGIPPERQEWIVDG